MNAVKRLMAITCLFFLVYTCPRNLYAETLLGRVITVDVKNKPLQTALEMISRKGEFYFSYNSSIVNSDSIVSITATDMKVGQILYRLFTQNYTFSETGNYIIIKKSPLHPAVVMRKAVTQNYSYTITGYISSDRTGEKLDKTSVYNKQALVSAITNNSGYFSLKVSTKLKLSAITISKEYYEDTTVAIQPGYNQQINIALIPVDTLAEITTISPVPLNLPADTLAHPVIIDSSKLIYTTHHIDSSWRQKTRLGQFFASAAQKIQGLNIGRFIAERPYQVSVTPGLGTHGKLSGQVVNDFSFNILGGYNAGVRVAELGLLFNINRFDVKHVQAGGLFNITGGTVTGVELAGIHNLTGGNVTGVQVAGINNLVHGTFNGVQVSGVYNHTAGTVTGIQAAGIANYTRSYTKGIQVSGIANVSNLALNGIQAAGIFNYTKKLHGLQVGLINIAGSSDGYSIGLINIVVHGYHKINLAANEVLPFNITLKTGNHHLYSMLLGGINAKQGEKLYSFGYGLGTELRLTKFLSINPEISTQYTYRGSWKYTNLLNKFTPQVNITLIKGLITLTGGPVLNFYYSNQDADFAGYKTTVAPAGYHFYNLHNNRLTGWTGWNAGVTIF